MHDDGRPSQTAIALRLQPGEWQMFCDDCGFKVEKNTATVARCPDCGTRLRIAGETDLNAVMLAMPAEWRGLWCENVSRGGCACLGCANMSGGLQRLGFSKGEWKEWVVKNPNLISRRPFPNVTP